MSHGSKSSSSPLGIVLGVPGRQVLPGQDPQRVEELVRLMSEELGPAGMVEQLWIADIAYLTARIEYFRAGLRGYYAVKQRYEIAPPSSMDLQLNSILYEEEPWVDPEKEELRKLQENEFQPKLGETHLDDPAYTRMLGRVVANNLPTINKLDEVETRLLRERDRVIAQFDRRRRNAVQDAVGRAESIPPALPSPSQD